jgi:hypothetical protein
VEDVVQQFRAAVEVDGIHGGLRYLNGRTPHRFTGIYRYDGDVLRNVYLFDQFAPEQTHGQDVPMADAYCATVDSYGGSLEFGDVTRDAIPSRGESPVQSYCGVLIRDHDGNPFGTLCHYDVKPCDARISDAPVLERISPIILELIQTA